MKYITTLIILIISLNINAQRHNDEQKLDLDVSSYDAVHIYNKYGDVEVKGVKSGSAQIMAERMIKTKSKKKLTKALGEINLETTVIDNELIVYIESPFYQLKGDYDNDYMYYRNVNDGMFNSGNWNKPYADFSFDMEITLPEDVNLIVSTHEGILHVEGMKGELIALNHHDGLKLENIENLSYAHSHHGDVEVHFSAAPSNDISFDTHHGDIKVSFPSTPSAAVSFDSHHGSFYTDFDWRQEPVRLSKSTSRSKRKAKYKVGDKTTVSIGEGQYNLTFQTHHGDMYLTQH